MKKVFLTIFTLLFTLPLLCSCKNLDYNAYLSDVKSDLFYAETEEFSLVVSCVSKEYPYLSDGIASPLADSVEITLCDKRNALVTPEVYLLNLEHFGGEMSFRSVTGDYYYSKGVTSFPTGSVSVQIKWNNEVRELTATSVKNENTLSVSQILQKAVEQERDAFTALTHDGYFYGEIYVRLLRRDKNYYYVALVPQEGDTLSMLMDSENGELLAKRN